MNANERLAEFRVEFYDHSEQPLCEGYHASAGTVLIPSVGDTFQQGRSPSTETSPTYVVERRHFHITSGGVTVRIYGRDLQVTGGL